MKAMNTNAGAARGPPVVPGANPRYFEVAPSKPGGEGRQLVYPTGSDCASAPEQFDYERYLDFLQQHGHNFIYLRSGEQRKSQAAGGTFHLCMTPQPWRRTGPDHGSARRARS